MRQSPKKFKKKKTVQEGKCPPITKKTFFQRKSPHNYGSKQT